MALVLNTSLVYTHRHTSLIHAILQSATQQGPGLWSKGTWSSHNAEAKRVSSVFKWEISWRSSICHLFKFCNGNKAKCNFILLYLCLFFPLIPVGKDHVFFNLQMYWLQELWRKPRTENIDALGRCCWSKSPATDGCKDKAVVADFGPANQDGPSADQRRREVRAHVPICCPQKTPSEVLFHRQLA